MYKGVKGGHYYVVDLIRMVAASLVVLYHFGLFDNAPTGKTALPFLAASGAVGDVGVEIFFVISGLVIAMSAENLRGMQGALRFVRLRASRILPALWISSLIGFAMLLLNGGSLPTLAVTLLKSATLSPIGPYIDGVVWSLVVEAVFYLTVAATILAAPRMSLETLAKLICAASTVYLIAWTAAFLSSDHLFELLSRFPSKVFLLRHGVFFALGMLLCSSLRGNHSASNRSAMLVATVMCVLEMCVHKELAWGASLGSACIWLAAIAIMVTSIVHAGAIERRLDDRARRTLRYLGSFSYPLYLNHYTLGYLVLQALLNHFRPVSQLPLIAVFVASVCVVLAMAAFVTSAERLVVRRLRSRTLGAVAVKSA
jgi:peptidoglycan/LPS O-acetylase OafA/YrhL